MYSRYTIMVLVYEVCKNSFKKKRERKKKQKTRKRKINNTNERMNNYK